MSLPIPKDTSEQDHAVRSELWKEVVKAVRTQLERFEAEGKVQEPRVDEPLSNEFIATTRAGFISVWLHLEDGTGNWNQIAPVDQCEPWTLDSDGTATLSEKRITVHELAHAFASKLVGPDR